jgi:hypothetical protein
MAGEPERAGVQHASRGRSLRPQGNRNVARGGAPFGLDAAVITSPSIRHNREHGRSGREAANSLNARIPARTVNTQPQDCSGTGWYLTRFLTSISA